MIYPLLPFAWIYDFVTSVRNFMYDHGALTSESYDIPVICVGNLTVGGTGKTPHTEYLIRLLLDDGMRVGVLSRGYKRKSRGYVLAGPDSTVADLGDEPFQMFRKFPELVVAVDADRRRGIYNMITDARTSDVDVILLDDAFQHRRVNAGLNILLVDSNRPVFRDYLMPAGRLRENARGIKRADIVVMTKVETELGENADGTYRRKLHLNDDQQLFFSHYSYGKLYNAQQSIELSSLEDYSVLLVTGIANPRPLESELSKYTSFDILRFGDHHNFSSDDYRQIIRAYESLPDDKLRIIITTEKDFSRIDLTQLPMAQQVFALPVEVEFINEQLLFNERILNYVRKNPGNSVIPQGENE